LLYQDWMAAADCLGVWAVRDSAAAVQDLCSLMQVSIWEWGRGCGVEDNTKSGCCCCCCFTRASSPVCLSSCSCTLAPAPAFGNTHTCLNCCCCCCFCHL
jgi:hypothetical protein